MSASTCIVELVPVKSTAFQPIAGTFESEFVEAMRRRLVDAQVEVLRMYLEKRPTEQLLGALDRLIDCTHASFREEEALMDSLECTPDPAHREMHSRVLTQLVVLRSSATGFDRGRLLAHLIIVDRQLTSHISDAVQMSTRQPPEFPHGEGLAEGGVAESHH